jgi:hypothetical protein
MITRTRVAAAAPQWVRGQLDGPVREARVVHAGLHAMYVAVPGPNRTRCVGLLSRSGSLVPCGLRTALADLSAVAGSPDPLAPGDVVAIGDGMLQLRAADISVGRILDLSAPRIDPAGAAPAARRLRMLIGNRAAAVRAELPAEALTMLVGGDPASVPMLLGLGSGLTPVGDDVLAGWIATMGAARSGSNSISDSAAERSSVATTLLSATLLDRARAGEVLPEFGQLLGDLHREPADPQAPRLAIDVDLLVAIGHTSGVGLLLGCLLALDHLNTGHLNTRSQPS